MEIQVISHKDRPDFSERLSELEGESFPEFLLHDGFDECRPHLLGEFARYQLYFVDNAGGSLLGAANALPYFRQADEPLPGYQQLLVTAPDQFRRGIMPNVLCPVQAMVVDDARGSGVSERIISAYKDLASADGLKAICVPVRPTLQPLYPLAPIERYATWTRENGEKFDPWLRMQERTGAKFTEIANDSTVITAPVSDWEAWTGIKFPESGEYVILGGHVPLVIDCEIDIGRYSEPHVWYTYQLG